MKIERTKKVKEFILKIEMPNDFKTGLCDKCQFANGSDQCKLTELLTNGTCLLNCFCPLKLQVINKK